MVIGERYYCIKNRWYDFDDISSNIINRCGCFYEVISIDTRNNNAVWMSNECGTHDYYYVIQNYRNNYLFKDYFITNIWFWRLHIYRIYIEHLRKVLNVS